MNDSPQEHRRLGRGMIAAAWLVVLGLLWLGAEDYLAGRDNPNRHIAVGQEGQTELVLKRNRSGHYVAPGVINGQPVSFLIDTGATQVSVPAHLASALSLAPGSAQQVITANGPVTVRATQIEELVLGPFRVTGVRGHLNPGMRHDEILLGMSVLRHLEFTQRGDILILRPGGG